MPALFKLLAAAAPAAEPDADLLARFVAARDDDAFAELVRRHGPAVYGTCRRLVGPSAADDAFQATFLVLAARAGSVRKAASVGSWLVGVAGRVARRMRLRDRRHETGDAERPEPACSVSPVSHLLSQELGEALADEFTRLPDRLRAAAVACIVDGHTQEQAAAALGWSSRTVRRRLDEAKGLLRTRLERRGVTPAAAAAAVAAAGEAAALPAGLARRATDAATLFLAGGGADARAAALAHGVIGTMTTIRSTTAAAVCAAVLAGLGIGWANDAPQPAPTAAPATKAEPDRIPPPAAPKALPAAAAHTHRTANFVVEAPTEVVARALGDGFERQRTAAATEWLGKDLPAWKTPAAVRVEAHPSGDYLTGTVRFSAIPGAEVETGISGRLDALLNRDVRWWPTQYVLMTHLGGHLPRWAGDVVAHLDDPEVERLVALRNARRQVDEGHALRLTTLFKMTTPPPGAPTADQSFAVACFLLARAPDLRHAIVEGGSHALTDPAPPLAPGQSAAKRGLLTFIESGGRLTDVYGFASVDEMERAWIGWVRAQPGPPPQPADPLRIPASTAQPSPAAPKAVTPAPHTHRTANYVVEAPTTAAARALGNEFERQRKAAAVEWLGKELPDWT